MATVTEPIILDRTGVEIAQELRAIKNVLAKGRPTIYAFHIDGSESSPEDMITYLEDAVGMTPAYMDYTADKFNYGSWKNAFFMPKPCMLKYDGTVDYYLNPNDYSKKADGTASDIADLTYGGNAMMEFPHIWIKIVPDEGDDTSATIYVSDSRVDDDYHDWSNHNCQGIAVEHFYLPIYNGSVSDSKMRSMSGQQVSKTLAGTTEITYAKANNPSADEMWNIECYADRLTINILLMLMGRSTNTQSVFGQGLHTGGSEAVNDGYRTGQQNAKGLFYGTNSGTATTYSNAVKVFGMENYWGFQWRRTNGYILSSGTQKVKLCYGKEDGSSALGYNTDGTDYIAISNLTPSGTSGDYIKNMKFTPQGMFGTVNGGTASTYYCDAQWYNNSGSRFALFGGHSAHGSKVGAFCAGLDVAVSAAAWRFGASVSCKPLG